VDLADAARAMFVHKCALRRETLPVLPCDCSACEWYIHEATYNNCFWALAYIFENQPGTKLSFEEIAVLEGVTVDEIVIAYETAINKLRKDSRNILKSDNFGNVS